MNNAIRKLQAKHLRTYLAEQGFNISHSKALEAVAKMQGFKDWNTAAASSEDPQTIYDEIKVERQIQDAKWGGPDHDDDHSIADFVAYLSRHAGKAVDASPSRQRIQMIRVAALGVAVVEKLDREGSSPKRIIVNGKSHEVCGHEISFMKIAELAFGEVPPNAEYLSMTYSSLSRWAPLSGIATVSEPIPLRNGMVFNAGFTGNA